MLEVLIVAGLAIAVGFALIFLLAVADKQSRRKNVRSAEPEMSRSQFEKACVEILERMKLDIHDIQRTDDDNLDIRARNPAPVVGGEFFIRCVYLPEGRIESAEILEMSNVIVQDRLSKGIFMTNGRFTEDLTAISELAPIEFIDGARLKAISSNLPMV
jgi:restriction endonuclease Mrr